MNPGAIEVAGGRAAEAMVRGCATRAFDSGGWRVQVYRADGSQGSGSRDCEVGGDVRRWYGEKD